MPVNAPAESLHVFLDTQYGDGALDRLRAMLDDGADLTARVDGETPLHVATRRRRCDAIALLLERGAPIDDVNAHGKSAYAHAIRRRFDDVVAILDAHGADPSLNDADRFAVAVVEGRLDDARVILAAHPGVARTGNPEDDRLLADVAGRGPTEPVDFLIEAGADLAAPALDDGTPLHQAAWFGQPRNAQRLIAAGAPLDIFDRVHESSPLGWVAHGSRYSGGADERQDVYVELAHLLVDAGASVRYPDAPAGDRAYLDRLLTDATPAVAAVIRAQHHTT